METKDLMGRFILLILLIIASMLIHEAKNNYKEIMKDKHFSQQEQNMMNFANLENW